MCINVLINVYFSEAILPGFIIIIGCGLVPQVCDFWD